MIKVFSTQFNFCYDKEIRMPYTMASLISYCKTIPEVRDNFQFEKIFMFRQNLDEYVDRASDADILLCSCYSWNWEINVDLARRVKEKNARCLVIFGGPQVSVRDEDFFQRCPFVDFAVYSEGEYALGEILLRHLVGQRDYSDIPGVGSIFFSNPNPRRVELDEIPSPYLSGLISELTEVPPGNTEYIVSWETNRGCPYSCAFCDWGGCLSSKIRKRSLDVLQGEINWFAENKIDYIDCCDANFGILYERDKKIAQMLSLANRKTGYPKRIRPAWTKNISEKTIEIAKILKSVDMLKGVTTDLQSLSDQVLQNINRKNATLQKYKEVTRLFSEQNIPTYTELILGLPGETLESWKGGLKTLIEETDLSSLYVYNCILFPNALMGDKAYQEKFQIKALRSPIYLTHSSISNVQAPQEYEYILTESSSFKIQDLFEMFYFSWQVQVFCSLGLLEYVLKYVKREKSSDVVDFFKKFDEYFVGDDLISREVSLVKEYIRKGYSGGGWDHNDESFGQIFWSIEEASWLRLVSRYEDFFNLVAKFLQESFGIDSCLIRDLIKFQNFMLTTERFSSEQKVDSFEYDWKDYFNGGSLSEKSSEYVLPNLVSASDDWHYKVMWYGRAQRKYKNYLNQIEKR